MARRSVLLAGLLWAVTLPQAATAQAPAPSKSSTLAYDVIDIKNKKLVHTLRGWSEEPADPSGEVTAVSVLEFPTGTVAEVRARFTRDSPPRCLSWRAAIHDRNGAEVASGSQEVVPAAYPFLTKPLPPNTYPPLAPLGYVLTRLGLGRAQAHASFHFLLMENSLLQMDLKVEGRETVDVPAGTFDTFRVSMRVNPESVFPDLPGFLLPFVSFFIPTQTVWITAQEPQMLVKFTGQIGPPGSPELLIHLTSIKPLQ